jgi:hypothetical protein
VVAETLKAACNAGQVPDLYFWRDHRGHEIDLLVETPDGPHAVEIKSGETVAGDFFKGLAHWRSLAGRSTPATVVYGGRESYVRRRRRPRLARLDVSAAVVDDACIRRARPSRRPHTGVDRNRDAPLDAPACRE